MIVYYVLFTETSKIKYLELEKKPTKKEIKEMFKDIKESIEVYADCCNFGLINLVYKNY